VIIKSPGIPPNPQLDAQHSKLTSSTQIFFDTIAESGSTVIGVTGSKGKSTTASLLFAMLKLGKKEVHLVGNIGEPAISHIHDAKNRTLFVMEMSSYQLMDLTVSPQIAVITSFFPEHLNYHGSLEAYMEAKKHITKFQKPGDMVFFCAASHGAVEIAKDGEGTKIPFAAGDAPIRIEETKLLGDHNLSNIAGAFTVATRLGIPEDKAINVIKAFEGLPHRLQNLGIHNGKEWIDDAISTTPESAIAALDALGNVTTIILGGQDRGNDFNELTRRIKASAVHTVILFPGSGPRIKQALKDNEVAVECFDAATMEEAVSIAKKAAGGRSPVAGHPIILLSTASPSYGMFKNFEEKGDQFQTLVKNID
jgi:UDP-N-acetylmuramoylalanine--D-glutamate ligase